MLLVPNFTNLQINHHQHQKQRLKKVPLLEMKRLKLLMNKVCSFTHNSLAFCLFVYILTIILFTFFSVKKPSAQDIKAPATTNNKTVDNDGWDDDDADWGSLEDCKCYNIFLGKYFSRGHP